MEDVKKKKKNQLFWRKGDKNTVKTRSNENSPTLKTFSPHFPAENIFVIQSNTNNEARQSGRHVIPNPVRWFGTEGFWKGRVLVQMKPADSLVSGSTADKSLLTRCSSSALTPPGGSVAKLEQRLRDDKTK